jgi:hypothetical protein
LLRPDRDGGDLRTLLGLGSSRVSWSSGGCVSRARAPLPRSLLAGATRGPSGLVRPLRARGQDRLELVSADLAEVYVTSQPTWILAECSGSTRESVQARRGSPDADRPLAVAFRRVSPRLPKSRPCGRAAIQPSNPTWRRMVAPGRDRERVGSCDLELQRQRKAARSHRRTV